MTPFGRPLGQIASVPRARPGVTPAKSYQRNQAAIQARRYHRHLSGQQRFVKVYSTRVAFGLEPLRLPPPLTAAHTNPVDALIITQRRPLPPGQAYSPGTPAGLLRDFCGNPADLPRNSRGPPAGQHANGTIATP